MSELPHQELDIAQIAEAVLDDKQALTFQFTTGLSFFAADRFKFLDANFREVADVQTPLTVPERTVQVEMAARGRVWLRLSDAAGGVP